MATEVKKVTVYESIAELYGLIVDMPKLEDRKLSLEGYVRDEWVDEAAGAVWEDAMREFKYGTLYDHLKDMRNSELVQDPDDPDLMHRVYGMRHNEWNDRWLREYSVKQGLEDYTLLSDAELLARLKEMEQRQAATVAAKPEQTPVWHCWLEPYSDRYTNTTTTVTFAITKELYDQLEAVWTHREGKRIGRLTLREMSKKLNGKDETELLVRKTSDKKVKKEAMEARNRTRRAMNEHYVALFALIIAQGDALGITTTMSFREMEDKLKIEKMEE